MRPTTCANRAAQAALYGGATLTQPGASDVSSAATRKGQRTLPSSALPICAYRPGMSSLSFFPAAATCHKQIKAQHLRQRLHRQASVQRQWALQAAAARRLPQVSALGHLRHELSIDLRV